MHPQSRVVTNIAGKRELALLKLTSLRKLFGLFQYAGQNLHGIHNV